jgi:hypothetical protein
MSRNQGVEELSIKKIRNGIKAIEQGTKTPEEASLGYAFNKLKDLNEGMYNDFLIEYQKVLNDYKEKIKNKL